MNGLEITVLAIVVLCALVGYYRGFLRVAYSIAAWFIIFALVTFVTPYLTEFLEKNTPLKASIQESCADYIEQMAEERIAQETEEYGAGQSGQVPSGVMEEIMGSAAVVIGGALEESGLYEEVAGQIAHFIIEGIAFFIVLTAGGILTFWISHMLNLVSKIPAIEGPNRFFGAVAGGLKSLIIVWLMFYVIRICAASEFGAQCMDAIEKSRFLKPLYDNNLLFLILMAVMKK